MLIFQSEEFKELLLKNLVYILAACLVLGGGLGFILTKQYLNTNCNLSLPTKTAEEPVKNIKIDLSGAVKKPGVYEVQSNSRVGDVIILGGGFTSDASSEWVSKNINLSKTLVDSAKIYIPFEWEIFENFTYELIPLIGDKVLQSSSSSTTQATNSANTSGTTTNNDSVITVNVNTASLSDLDALSGIGPAYAQKIIDNRPYSNFDEFKTNSKIPQTTADNLKDKISF